MPSETDISVLDRDTPFVRLIAEIKPGKQGSPVDIERAASELRESMHDQKSAIGLLVTPDWTRIYRDAYLDRTPTSIELIGEYSTRDLLCVDEVSNDPHGLERQVHDWLEDLTVYNPTAIPKSADLRDPVLDYIIPEVVEGRILSGSVR